MVTAASQHKVGSVQGHHSSTSKGNTTVTSAFKFPSFMPSLPPIDACSAPAFATGTSGLELRLTAAPAELGRMRMCVTAKSSGKSVGCTCNTQKHTHVQTLQARHFSTAWIPRWLMHCKVWHAPGLAAEHDRMSCRQASRRRKRSFFSPPAPMLQGPPLQRSTCVQLYKHVSSSCGHGQPRNGTSGKQNVGASQCMVKRRWECHGNVVREYGVCSYIQTTCKWIHTENREGSRHTKEGVCEGGTRGPHLPPRVQHVRPRSKPETVLVVIHSPAQDLTDGLPRSRNISEHHIL